MAKMEFKSLSLKRRGWKRVARNTTRFGWNLENATELTTKYTTTTYEGKFVNDDTVEISPRDSVSYTTTIELTFSRDRDKIENMFLILMLEFWYKVFFVLRKFFGKFAIVAFVLVMISCSFLQNDTEMLYPIMLGCMSVIGIWLVMRFLENTFSAIAARVIKFTE